MVAAAQVLQRNRQKCLKQGWEDVATRVPFNMSEHHSATPDPDCHTYMCRAGRLCRQLRPHLHPHLHLDKHVISAAHATALRVQSANPKPGHLANLDLHCAAMNNTLTRYCISAGDLPEARTNTCDRLLQELGSGPLSLLLSRLRYLSCTKIQELECV